MQLTNYQVAKYDTISVPFPALSGQTKIMFPDQPQLRYVKTFGIELPAMNFDINGNTALNCLTTYLAKSYVTLYFEGKEGCYQMPLLELKSTEAPAGAGINNIRNVNGLITFNGQKIVWSKCYITLANATPFGSNSVFILGVYYNN